MTPLIQSGAPPTTNWIACLVLLIYLAVTLAIGLWMGRGSNLPDEFMAGGRRLPAWAVGLSIFGTYVSSISFLALPGKAYASNWNAFVFSLSIPIATAIAVRYFVPFYRRAGSVSSYEHLEQRFGRWARLYAVFCYLLTQQARMGAIMYLAALAIAPITGLPITGLIVAASAVVVLYTLLGGIKAVIWTDVMQSVVLIVGALLCAILLVLAPENGPADLFETAMAHDKFSLGSLRWDFTTATFWTVLVYGLFVNLQNFGIDQSYVQRYQTARSDRSAARSVWLGALLYIPVSAVFFFIGTALFVFYTEHPDLVPPTGFAKPDQVFPHFIAHNLPAPIAGLVIAAVFAAAQSTISGSINSSATLIACDLYKPIFNTNAGPEQLMRVLRLASLAVGVGGTCFALGMIRIRTALDAWWELASIFSGGMLGLFLLGLISRAPKNAAAIAGTLAGVLAILWITVSNQAVWPAKLAHLRCPLHNFMAIVVGTLVILLLGLLLSNLPSRGRSRTSSGKAGASHPTNDGPTPVQPEL